MQEAVPVLNANGEGDTVVTERFEVVEQVHAGCGLSSN